MTFQRLAWAYLFTAALFAAPTLGERPPAFGDRLGQFIPGDVWVFTSTAHTPSRDFLKPHWDRVHRALSACGLADEFKNVVTSHMHPEEKAHFDNRWAEATDLIQKVRWSDLLAQEFAFAERFGGLVPDIIFLCRPAPESLEANVEGLHRILATLASLNTDGKFRYVEGEEHGVHWWSLEASDAPIGISMLHKGEVLGFVIGQRARRDVVNLLAGNSTPGLTPITASKRYRQALEQVPAPEHSMVFLDFDRLLGAMRRLPEMMFGQLDPNDEVAAQSRKVLDTIVGHCDSVDYIVASSHMKGMQEFTDSYARLKPGCESTSLSRMCFQRKPIENVWRYVPVEAEGFTASTLVDFSILYETVLDTVRTAVPGGEEVLEKWSATQANWNFDVREDVLSWLSGEMVNVSLPATTRGAWGGAQNVLLLRVKDKKKAAEKVAAGLDRIQTFMTANGQPLLVADAAQMTTPGFKSVSHPILAMFAITPCIGVWEDWLVLGSSASSAELVFSTAAGEHANILKNERFRKEGLIPQGPVNGAAFADLRDFGNQMTTAFITAGVVAGMIPDEPAARPLKAMIGSLSKLGPVFAELDFLSSMSAVTAFEKGAMRSQKVLTYRSAPDSQTSPQVAP